MKSISKLLIMFCLVISTVVSFADMSLSGGEIVTGNGVWYTNYNAARSYAEQNHLPLILFWASPGCSECRKLEEDVAEPDFVAWMKTKNYVFCFVEGTDGEGGSSDAKAFAKNGRLTLFPFICIYQKNLDGSVIKSNFSGRSGTMPSTEGKGLRVRLMNSIEKVLNGTSAVIPSGDVSAVPFWSRSMNIDGRLYTDALPLSGIAEIKFGKPNKKTGKAKVTASVTPLGGSKKRISGTVSAFEPEVSVSSSFGTLTLAVNGQAYAGVLSCADGTTYRVESTMLGGTFNECTLHLKLEDYPTFYVKGSDSLPVFTQYLPGAVEMFDFWANGSKWTFPRKGTVKWDRKAKQFVTTVPENPSGLKLSYSSRTGVFKGSYKTYAKSGDSKVKKITTKVTGYVYNGVGYGVATANGLPTALIQILR